MTIKKFWLEQSKSIYWQKKPSVAFSKKKDNYIDWFPDGKLNVFYNCVTKNLNQGLGGKIAIYFINKEKKIESFTYKDLDEKINIFSNILLSNLKIKNLKKTKIVIHGSASIETTISMFACAKLGIHFSVIFEDLAPEAIHKRILLLKPNLFITRFSKTKFTKDIFSKIKLKKMKLIFFENIKYLNKKINIKKISPIAVNSNKELFTLFTSGSTGVPKGIVHSSGGYLVATKYTSIKQFGMNTQSVVLTASDAGWLNGHTYALFGPLSLGATTVLLESPMLLVDENFLKKILNLKVSILYVPVTIIRMMKAVFGDKKFHTKYLKTLGSMGEHLASSVAEWFSDRFTSKNKSVINCYYQTENGATIFSPTYKDTIKKVPHGSTGKSVTKFLKTNKLDKNQKKEIKLLTPWPGNMKKIINGNHEWKKYWDKQGNFRMFDLGTMYKGNLFVHGRSDDVINIRGHRIGSAEIESTVLKVKEVFECCAISLPDEMEGHVIYLFVVSKKNVANDKILGQITANFGTFALPKKIFHINELPKTRSGKILRRLLRLVLVSPDKAEKSDLTIMLNKKVIKDIIKNVKN
mgnify:CR=1 FL=1|jgi:acetyl-CoA synthetase|tara:strand:+ start:2926 stop:4662 length:1737 start_codon:yes stop_codon:yes gene_type:complete